MAVAHSVPLTVVIAGLGITAIVAATTILYPDAAKKVSDAIKRMNPANDDTYKPNN
jgi:hypothetical protein